MADESGFLIGGNTYPVPSLGTLNMDEAQVLYDYSGLVIEDFLSLLPEAAETEKEEHQEELARRMRNPALLRSLMHIAYQRGNTDVRAAQVKEIVAGENALEAILAFVEAEVEGDELPPASTTEPEPSSPSGSVVSSTSSGHPSANDSAPPEDPPGSTGPGRSDTSPTSAPKLQAV